MCYIELKNEKYETLEDLKRLLHYILRLDKTAEDSQRANTITNTLAGCQPAMIPNEYLCDPSSVYSISPPTNFCMASSVLSSSISFGSSIGRSARTLIFSSFIVCLQIKTGQSTRTVLQK